MTLTSLILIGEQYTTHVLKDVYHARWGTEELYKVSKQLVEVDDFHGCSERGVKQELFAHFVLITLSRLCANASEDLLSGLLNLPGEENPATESNIQVNFKKHINHRRTTP